jgi:quinol monooxygenase YgiN
MSGSLSDGFERLLADLSARFVNLPPAKVDQVPVIAWGLRIQVPAAKRSEIEGILRSLLGPARVRSGCLGCHVYQDTEDPKVLALIQEWASPDDLERYLRSEDYPKLLALLESAAHRPEIWFDTITAREGLERLAAVGRAL